MKNNNPKTKFFILIGVFLIVVVIGIILTQKIGQTPSEKSQAYLKRYLKTINVKTENPTKTTLTLEKTSLKDELPDISEYDLTVQGNGSVNIEIFSSPEKGGEGVDGWLREVAENFNSSKYRVNGKLATVSVRNISSGDAVDYIVSQKYAQKFQSRIPFANG